MPDTWPAEELGEVGVSVLDCVHATPSATDHGFPYIAIPNIVDGRIDLTGVRRISASDHKSWTAKTEPKCGDVVVTRRGRVGDTAPIPGGLECAIGQNLVLLRSDGTAVDQTYLRWAAQGPLWMAEVDRLRNVGAIFDSLNVRDIARMRIPVPPIATQRRIAEVLGLIDDLIDANEELVDDLDQQFVAISAQYEKRATGRCVLGERIRLKKGLSYKGAYLAEEGLPLINLGSFGRNGRYRSEGIKHYSAEVKERHLLRRGDLVIANTDLTQSRDLLARPLLVPFDRASSTHHTFQVTTSSDSEKGWVYGMLRNERRRLELIAYSTGTTVAALPADALTSLIVPWPEDEERQRWWEGVEPLLLAQSELGAEAELLRRTRDQLLPLLLSGRLRVGELVPA